MNNPISTYFFNKFTIFYQQTFKPCMLLYVCYFSHKPRIVLVSSQIYQINLKHLREVKWNHRGITPDFNRIQYAQRFNENLLTTEAFATVLICCIIFETTQEEL